MISARRIDVKRVAYALLLALALLPRLVVPTGYMPQAGAQGFTITMCGGMAPVTVALPSTPGKSNPAHEAATKPCAFAAAVSQAALEPLSTTLGQPVLPRVNFVLSRGIADLITPRLAAPPPPSQAPPLTI